MAQNPVCHIPPTTVETPHGPVPIPSIPAPQPNIASLTATVSALRNAFMILSGQRGPAGAQGTAGKSPPTGSWAQGEIVTETVKIFQNNDPSTGNFVEVQRINKLTFNNKQTQQTIVFNRPPSSGD